MALFASFTYRPAYLTLILLALGGLLLASKADAQQQSTYASPEVAEGQTQRARISDSFITTTKDEARGGLISPFAEGLDASTQNPARIGVNRAKPEQSVSQFHFPYAAASYNEDSQDLSADLINAGGAGFSEFSQAITSASNGKAQYARTSAALDFGFKNVLITPLMDQQLAAARIDEASDSVELLYQQRSAIGGGLSFADPTETLRLGFFGAYSSLKRVTGLYSAEELGDAEEQKALFQGTSVYYTGMDMNIGLSWRIVKKAEPTLNVTVNHLGGTTYQTNKAEVEPLEDAQKLNLGFGVTPPIGRWASLNFGVGMMDLTNKELDTSKKWQSSLELNTFGVGNHAVLGLRTGVNSKGMSYGSHINIGFIGLQYANFPEDIGIDGHPVIERRNAASIAVDLAN